MIGDENKLYTLTVVYRDRVFTSTIKNNYCNNRGSILIFDGIKGPIGINISDMLYYKIEELMPTISFPSIQIDSTGAKISGTSNIPITTNTEDYEYKVVTPKHETTTPSTIIK